MEPAELSLTDETRIQALSRDVEGLHPGVVLRWGAGAVRGFWARGGRWVAHVGSVANVRVEEGSAGRFRAVWEKGRRLLRAVDSATVEGVDPVADPRLYGGFSFRDTPDADPFWDSFPSAGFVLPEVEVMGEGERGRVTLRRVPGSGRERDEGWRGLRRRLDRISEAWTSESGPVRQTPGDVVDAELVEIARDAWEDAVAEAVEAIEHGAVEKVVLARTLDVSPVARVDPVRAVLNLWRENPGTHVFLYEPESGAALIGAAPETVATVTDGRFRATAVAGSIGRGASPEEQEALALRLLESEKDRVEHAIAVRDMVERLRPLVRELGWDSEPHVLTLSRIQHLETRIQAILAPGEHVLSALSALHPTPAVCGLPRDAALRFLRVEEPFTRGWYAGPLGWFDASGDGVFAPALRCAVSRDSRWRLFAGAGIVEASIPSLEWEETRIKFLPALRALEVEGMP